MYFFTFGKLEIRHFVSSHLGTWQVMKTQTMVMAILVSRMSRFCVSKQDQ
jgi:hypothetical protein